MNPVPVRIQLDESERRAHGVGTEPLQGLLVMLNGDRDRKMQEAINSRAQKNAASENGDGVLFCS